MSQTPTSSSVKKNATFSKNCFISKNELLSWVNDLLKVNMTLVEQLGSGTMYCQILDVIYPGQVPLTKVKWGAKLEYDFLHNFKILQQSFDKLQVPKMIPVNKLAKAKYQDNLEFAQWMKAYFDFNCKDKGRGYDALKRRSNATPYFGFCKGGVLPKQTLFFRNPNDKFTADDFSSSSFSSQHEQEFPDHESLSNNTIATTNQVLFRSESTPLKQNSFFSNSSPQSNEGAQKPWKQQQSLPQQQLKTATSTQQSQYNNGNSFFNRKEQQPQQNQTNSNFFEGNNKQSQVQNNFFGRNESQLTDIKNSEVRSNLFFSKNGMGSEVTTKVGTNSIFKENPDNFSKKQENSFFNNNNGQQQEYGYNNNSSSLIENNFFNRGSGQTTANQNTSNNYFNQSKEDVSPRFFNKTSTDKYQEKKTPTMSTSNLLSKIQQLTEASQILLRKNSETSEKSNTNAVFKQASQDRGFFEDKSPAKSTPQNSQNITNNNVSFTQSYFNNTIPEHEKNQNIRSNENSNSFFKANTSTTNESKIDFYGCNYKNPKQEEALEKQTQQQQQQQQKVDTCSKEQIDNQQNNSQNSLQSPLLDGNFFKKYQEQSQVNNIFSNNEKVLEKQTIQQQNQNNKNLNFFGNSQSDSEENILNGNIFSQESASSQQQQQTDMLQVDQIIENKAEIISPKNEFAVFENRQKVEHMNHLKNENEEMEEDEQEDADISNSYETPICKKQKKNEDNNNFSKSIDKYNQKTIQLMNRENITPSSKSNTNENEQNQKVISNKDRIESILSIIQSCQEDYDTAMKQILGICMP